MQIAALAAEHLRVVVELREIHKAQSRGMAAREEEAVRNQKRAEEIAAEMAAELAVAEDAKERLQSPSRHRHRLGDAVLAHASGMQCAKKEEELATLTVEYRAPAAEHARSVAELRDAQEQHQRSLDDHAREMAAVVEQHSATVAALHSDHGTAILEARLELAAQAEAAASERKKQQQEWRSRWQAKVVAAEGKGSAGGL